MTEARRQEDDVAVLMGTHPFQCSKEMKYIHAFSAFVINTIALIHEM